MVDLPSLQGTPANVSVPTSRVSPAEVAQPYAELAANLDRAGHVLSKDIAQPLAEQEGMKAVTRDAQGNLVVAKAPFYLGDSATDYYRAVKFSALAQGEAESRQKDLELSKQFKEDPEGYLIAARAFRDAKTAEYTKQAGPEVGLSLGRAIDNQTTYNYRWLWRGKENRDSIAFDRNAGSEIKAAETDLLTLAESAGAEGISSPNGQALLSKYQELQRERVENRMSPRYGQDKVMAAEMRALDEALGASIVKHDVDKILHDPNGGVQKATEYVSGLDKVYQSKSKTQKEINQSAGLKAIKDFQDSQTRQAHLESVAQKQTDETFLKDLMADTAPSGPHGITENDIRTNRNISFEAQKRALDVLHRVGLPEPLSHVSAQTTVEAMRRMNLPDGDPSKIKDNGPLVDLFGQGKLTTANYDWLEKQLLNRRTPEGSLLAENRKDFLNKWATTLDPSILDQTGPSPHYGRPSALGSQRTLAAEKELEHREKAMLADPKQGITAALSLYDPESPNFVGKWIGKYHTPLAESNKYDADLKKRGAAAVAPGSALQQPAVPPQPAAQPQQSAATPWTPPRWMTNPQNFQYNAAKNQYRSFDGRLFDSEGNEIKSVKR